MSIKEKAGKFMDEHSEYVVIYTMTLLSIGIGYVAGGKLMEARLSSGLKQVFTKNPEIETLMKTAIKEIKNGK